MSRASLIALCLLASGCSLIFVPDRDQIIRDRDGGDAGVPDGGVDGGIEGGVDGGMDAGPGCTPTEGLEITCTGGEDEDCDGEVDCFDFDCRGAAVCCTGTTSTDGCLDSSDPEDGFEEQPVVGDIQFSAEGTCGGRRVTRFSLIPGQTRALVSRSCQPINFGMTYELDFTIESACASDCVDYAALSFGLVQQMVDGEEYEDEFRFVIAPDGSAYAERAGVAIGTAAPAGRFLPGATQLITLRVELEPGPDTDGVDVLFATATVAQGEGPAMRSAALLERVAVMPLDALTCFLRGGGSEAGLFAVIEGTGNQVSAHNPVQRTERACANPSQFRAPSRPIDLATVEACDVGGVGSPSLINYCFRDCDDVAPQVQWDLWVDSSDRPRDEDEFDFVDFGTCGYSASTVGLFPSGTSPDNWIARDTSDAPYLFEVPPGAREPTVLAVSDDGAATRVQNLWYAYARRMSTDLDDFEIWGATVQRPRTVPAREGAPILHLTDAGIAGECVALRDPLLVAKYEPAAGAGEYAVAGAYLLFTCDRMPAADTIGVVEVMEMDGGLVTVGTANASFLTEDVGTYADRGLFGPEGFTEPSAAGLTLRLWFLARGADPRPTIAFAQGRGPLSAGLPAVNAYPANPILSSTSEVLQQDCDDIDCRLHGLTVTPVFNDMLNYQFLVARERRDGSSVGYDLVPLLQPRPMD